MSPTVGAEDEAAAGRLAHRYRLLRCRSRGGMATVHEAYDEQLGRHVAIKTLHEAVRGVDLERFRREATTAAALSHPGIVGVYDYGVDNGRHYLVLELVPGDDLARLLRADGRFEPSRAGRIAAQVSDALAHAHAAGTIHRDIKPANILVEPGDQARLTDFGIARLANTASVTATGTIVGTPTYCAPEQVAGEPVGPTADIYALGLVLYEMLTGAPPFDGDTATAIAAQRLTTPVPLPSAARPDLPAPFDTVVAGATARDPRDRYRTAQELGDALRSIERRPAGGPPPAAPRAPRRRLRSGRDWRVALTVLVLAGLAVAAGVGVGLRGGTTDEASDDQPTTDTDGGPDPDPERPAGPPHEPATAEPPHEPATAEDTFRITDAILGLDAAKVADELDSHGFDVETRTRRSDEPAGTVVDVDPPVGDHVSPGDPIVLHVAEP